MAYKVRDAKAVEKSDLIGSEHTLAVTAEVQVLKSNEQPHLAEAAPQGFNPKELILDLTVSGAGELGGNIVLWKQVSFEKKISGHQYGNVMLRQSGAEETIPVEQVLS